MRRRSERKKSTEAASSPAVVKRPARRSHRSSSQTDSKKSSKSEGGKASEVTSDSKHNSSNEQINNDDLNTRISPSNDDHKSPTKEPDLEPIQEALAEDIGDNSTENDRQDTTPTNSQEQNDEKSANDNKISPAEKTPVKNHSEELNNLSNEEQSSNKDSQRSPTEEAPKKEAIDIKTTRDEDSTQVKPTTKERGDLEKSEKTSSVRDERKLVSRNRERRSQLAKAAEERENDENEEVNNKSQKSDKSKNTRKRRWLSKKSVESGSQVLAISTDSLKNLISDVHPVPLCDVKLDSSSDVEEVESEREDGEASPTPVKQRIEKSSNFEREHKQTNKYEQPVRKISVLSDDYEAMQPVPPGKSSSCILYITNLVRPFTVLQLKGLLARTGKIVENGFWIDKIKSKCYVQYETEDEAVETRHALHGVRWPTSNPKCLHVDFGTAADMEKAMSSSLESGGQFGQENNRENRIIGTGWDRDRFDFEEKKTQVGRPVREWDVGKREELESETERIRDREKIRGGDRGERGDRLPHNDRVERESGRNKERGERERDRKRRSSDNDHHRSLSASPARKNRKKADPPLRLLDDLFRKTKTTPCIYWLPLTPEQIAEKEAFRLKRIAEHQERIRQRELEKEKEREREREREKDRRRERDRSAGHRRSSSRDRRRY